jgi:hypothetical protein
MIFLIMNPPLGVGHRRIGPAGDFERGGATVEDLASSPAETAIAPIFYRIAEGMERSESLRVGLASRPSTGEEVARSPPAPDDCRAVSMRDGIRA